jgi:hypothetical protein
MNSVHLEVFAAPPVFAKTTAIIPLKSVGYTVFGDFLR